MFWYIWLKANIKKLIDLEVYLFFEEHKYLQEPKLGILNNSGYALSSYMSGDQPFPVLGNTVSHPHL